MAPDSSENEVDEYEEKWSADRPHAHGNSYSEQSESEGSYESYESDYESPEKSYSDSDDTVSGESFENDYESPEEHYPSQPFSETVSYGEVDEEEEETIEDEAFNDAESQPLPRTSLNCEIAVSPVNENEAGQHSSSPPSRSTIRQRSGEGGKDEVKPAIRTVSQNGNSIQNTRRRVKWANPDSLNWSFHEGFVDNASRKRRELKRWNSSDDLVASSGKRRGGRRDKGSSRNSDRRQDYPVRDPPGHHIESPSIKTKIFPSKLASKSNDPSSIALQTRLPVVVEDDMPSKYEIERSGVKSDDNPIQPRRRASYENLEEASALPSGETDTRPTNIPIRSTSSDKVIPSNQQDAPLRRTKSSDGANSASNRIPVSSQAGSTGSIQTSISSSGSSDGKSKSGSTHRAPATARRILASNKNDHIAEASEWQSFEKTNDWVSIGKENPKLNNIPKRTPGRLSASLHDVGPRKGDAAVESSKFHSQSMHVPRDSNTNGLVREELPEKTASANNIPINMDVDESIRSTEESSDSRSFALQVSQSSFSSFQSEGSTAVKVHKNRPATGSIMSSATLTLTVFQARDLISLERNMFGKMKPAEAFVELYLGGKVCGKTGVARRSSNPTWKESEIVCEIGGDMARELSRTSEKLELRIYDRSNKKENFMGAIMFVLPKDDAVTWYSIMARSEQEADLYCAGATGQLEVKVQMKAKFYPALTPDHVFVLKQHSKIALDLSLTLGSFLETSCVATDSNDALVLWEDSVYFANRTNPNRSIVFPERLEIPGHSMIDTLVLDLDNIPKKIGALCLVLTARENFLSELDSFEVRCKDAITGQGIGRFVPRLNESDTSVVLLRMSRAKSNKTWDLEVMAKGYRGFREFGSMLPEIQMIVQGAAARTSRPAERTALMRAGDSIRVQDYAAELPKKLTVGLFWKVANGENVLPVALLLDKDSHLLDVIHRQNSQSEDLSVIYAEDRFEVSLIEADADIHYICFSLGPYLGEQADHILTAAFNILNPTDGTELVRSTIPDFDLFPTRTVTIGCFYRSLDSWAFALVGIPASDLTIDECARTIQTYLMEKPLDPPSPLFLES